MIVYRTITTGDSVRGSGGAGPLWC